MGLNIPWDLFKDLIKNELSENGNLELEYWKNSSELNRNIYNEICNDENLKKVLIFDLWKNPSEEWEKLLLRIKPKDKQISLTQRKLYLISATAAAVLLLIGFSISALVFNPDKDNNLNSNCFSSVFSPRGQRTQVVLPDSTKVWLNSESSMRYGVNYGQRNREVYIQGEAFFEVRKNPKKPFIVNTSEIKVKVYGTSFNIKAFPNEKYIETTLIEGKLSVIPIDNVGKFKEEIFLKPNEKCIYEKAGIAAAQNKSIVTSENDSEQDVKALEKLERNPNIIITKNVNADREMLWKNGKIIFKNETYGELAIKLERWYDVKIHFKDESIKKYRFTGSFEKETINQAMEALRLSSQKSYTYNIKYRDIYLQ